MLHCVDLVRTHVSQERSTSIIRATRIGELGTLAVTSNRHTLWRNTWLNIPEHGILQHFIYSCISDRLTLITVPNNRLQYRINAKYVRCVKFFKGQSKNIIRIEKFLHLDKNGVCSSMIHLHMRNDLELYNSLWSSYKLSECLE
jgi:hypothetical protein